MFRIKFSVLFFIIPFLVLSQHKEEVKDSIRTVQYKLDEVTVIGTAQHNPQSIKKAVYNVSVIKNKKIKLLAATSLEDVLRQSLNLKVIPNPATGKNSISLFGLDGQYVKVLVDNIPLVNDKSYGNDADLSQINLQDVKQIEIVEGAMAVEYGSNAVTGVVNIVTKKKSNRKLNVSVSILEETVGNEFEFFNKGKHIQSANVSGYLTDQIFTSVSFNRNDFAGYYKNRKGKYYLGEKGLRGHHWLPREQYNTSLLINVSEQKGWSGFYRFSFMNDVIDDYNKSFTTNFDPATGIKKSFANDRQFKTQRFYHNLGLNKELSDRSNLHFNFSLQIQERKQKDYIFYIKTHESKDEKTETISKMNVFTSLGAYNFETESGSFKGRLGYDIGLKSGLLSGLAVLNENENVKNKHLNHYDFYGFSEYEILPKLSLRAGIRGMFSEVFSTKVAYNVSSKYTYKDWQFRFVFGNSPRNPNFEELYYSFVDVNHYIVGNSALKAEKAISFTPNIKKVFFINDDMVNSIKLSANFIDVNDRITWVSKKDEKTSRDMFTPVNIDEYKAWSVALNEKFHYKSLEFSVGGMYLGVSQNLKSRDWDDSYLYSLQLNSSLSFRLPYGFTLSSYYKYNGKESRFAYGSDGKLIKTEQMPYHWLDASIKKSFFNNTLNIIVGARNLTDTNEIKSFYNKQAHSSPVTTRQFGYGRSYFSKITFNF